MSDLDRWILQQLTRPELWLGAILSTVIAWAALVAILA